MMQYFLRKGFSKFNNFRDAELEKELNQLNMQSTSAPTNVANMSEKEK